MSNYGRDYCNIAKTPNKVGRGYFQLSCGMTTFEQSCEFEQSIFHLNDLQILLTIFVNKVRVLLLLDQLLQRTPCGGRSIYIYINIYLNAVLQLGHLGQFWLLCNSFPANTKCQNFFHSFLLQFFDLKFILKCQFSWAMCYHQGMVL